MAIEKDVLKEMVGKRITIDGERHRVEKVVMKTGLIITRDGTEALAEGVYKKGPGFFYDSPKKGKKAAKPKDEEPVKETARARRARERLEAEEADKPKETARARRAREKLEAEEADKPKETARARRAREKLEAEEAEKPTSRRARNKNKDKDAEPAAPAGRKTRIPRDEVVPSKKKKMFDAFDQAIAERISQEAFDLLGLAYAERGTFGITAVAVGGKFDDDALKVTITFMPSVKDAKAIKSYIRDHREATDISSDEEEDDDLEDEDLEDADSEDEDLEENDDEEIEDDEDEDEEDEDDEEDEEDEDDEEEESVTVEEMVDAILEEAPDLKKKVLTKYVEGFFASDECTEKFEGELIPGFTKLQEKGGKGPECLLIGFDEEDEQVKLLNLKTLKTRSKTITEVVHMEVLDTEQDEE